jgi:hypothetical protein
MTNEQPQSGRWPLARWKGEQGLNGLLHRILCGVPTCSGVLGYAAPYRTQTAVLEPERPAKGLDGLTAHVLLVPSLRLVDGTNPLVFEMGSRARRSSGQRTRRPAGVLFPDGQIDRPEGRRVPLAVIQGTPIPWVVITPNGAVAVHKDKLPIIVQCPKVAAHRSEIHEEIDRE